VIDAHRPELVLGGRWRLVMPGLIDAHVHTRERLAAFLFPDTVASEEWMRRCAMSYHASLDEEAERVAVELQLATMALQGVSLYVEAGYVHLRSHLEALGRIGLRAVLCPWLGTYRSSTGRRSMTSGVSRTSWGGPPANWAEGLLRAGSDIGGYMFTGADQGGEGRRGREGLEVLHPCGLNDLRGRALQVEDRAEADRLPRFARCP
jgi:hypothetical protein